MSSAPDTMQTCDACGATIYPEMLASHAADRWAGKLLCAHCLREQQTTAAGDAARRPDAPPTPGAPSTQVRHNPTLGADRAATGAATLRRPLDPASPYATRCRTFHCRLSDGAILHLNEQINEWVDQHADVVIKFATSSIGVFEGKHAEPNLIVTLFY